MNILRVVIIVKPGGMKNIIILLSAILILCAHHVKAQKEELKKDSNLSAHSLKASANSPIINDTAGIKYFVLDSGQPGYKVTLVRLNGKQLYGIDSPVELYNLQYDKDHLILFSVLPVKSVGWKEIKHLPEGILDFKSLSNTFKESLDIYINSKGRNFNHLKRDNIKLILNKEGKMLESIYCVSEFFIINNKPVVFPNETWNAFINIQSPFITVKEFEQRNKDISGKFSENAVISTNQTGSTFLSGPFQRPLLFTSEKFKFENWTAYKFWQFSDWRVADGYNVKRGIDRFVYVPDIGIIGGSFDFYFQRKVPQDQIMDNYLSEKLIMPASGNDVILSKY